MIWEFEGQPSRKANKRAMEIQERMRDLSKKYGILWILYIILWGKDEEGRLSRFWKGNSCFTGHKCFIMKDGVISYDG